MPTGYTASVADGTVTDLKPFVLTLARGMGALVMMRDEPWDAPIPDRFEPSDYNLKRLEEAKAEHARVAAMQPHEIEEEIEAELEDYEERRDRAYFKHEQEKARYNAMIAKVEAWKGAPEGIKGFALDQLRQGRDFDCREPYRFWGSPPETDVAEWKSQRLATLDKEIAYHAKSYAEECERTEARNAWIKQLKESLGD